MKTLFQHTLISTLLLVPNLGLADNHSADLDLKSHRPINSFAKQDLTIASVHASGDASKKDLSNLKPDQSEKDLGLKRETLRERYKDTTAKRGGGDAGGGNPLLLHAVRYPDVKGLDRAIAIAKEKLWASSYPAKFKGDVSSEIDALKAMDLYRYIPEIIVLPTSGASDTEGSGVDVMVDDQTFMSLGGITFRKPGAAVIFSNRVKEYSAEDLAELLLHEVIHHQVSSALSKDEEFVEELAGSIIAGQKNQKLEEALRLGAYFRPGVISAEQFWDAIVNDQGQTDALSLFLYADQRYICARGTDDVRKIGVCDYRTIDLQKKEFLSQLPPNLFNVGIREVWNAIESATYHSINILKHDTFQTKEGEMKMELELSDALLRVAKRKTNPQAPGAQKEYWTGADFLMKHYFSEMIQ